MSETSKTIIVAGDVCIDWLSIPLDAKSTHPGQHPPTAVYNWQLRGGRRMYARHGGAWLTTQFTRDSAEKSVEVFGPDEFDFSPEKIAEISPDRLIHSLITLDRCSRPTLDGKESTDEEHKVLAITSFEGFAGPEPSDSSDDKVLDVFLQEGTPDTADIVLLDDAGNGFRDRDFRHPKKSLWPKAIEEGRAPTIIYKLRRPLSGGPLGQHLRAHHANRTIALLSVEELRAESDGAISTALSWERTATDVVYALHRTPALRSLLSYSHLVIPLGLEGVLYLPGGEGGGKEATLWFCPNHIEGDIGTQSRGHMTGFASAMAAAIAVTQSQGKTIGQGIELGMKAAWWLFQKGFGTTRPPTFPGKAIFEDTPPSFSIKQAKLPPYPQRMNLTAVSNVPDWPKQVQTRYDRDMTDFRNWTILSSMCAIHKKPYASLAEAIVREGVKEALKEVPVAKFGDLELVDRREIESYRAVRNLVREFLKNKKPERPLCLAVFGPPGAGKSYGVVQVTKSLMKANPQFGEIEKFEFNVSQWQSPNELAYALHHVRDSAIRGNIPLVFFDEFDSKHGSNELAWLKFFLAPMQDGKFQDGSTTHEIGRAIFVFAGGTCDQYGEFQQKATNRSEVMRAAKAPDFLSRLRGHVNVQPIGKPIGVQLLRRAILFRSFLQRKCKHVIDSKTGIARVHPAVIKAFLNISEYRHGVRSIEAILEMSRLEGYAEITSSLFPPTEQLELHVPAEEFQRLTSLSLDLGTHLETLARKAHETFVESMKGKRDPNHASMQPWDKLSALYQNSNREQAAHIPIKLAAISCDCGTREQWLSERGYKDADEQKKQELGAEFDKLIVHPFTPEQLEKLTKGEPIEPTEKQLLSTEEVEKLAKLEHERFNDERRASQPDHKSLVEWEDLSETEKEKDRVAVRAIPQHLKDIGLTIFRLS